MTPDYRICEPIEISYFTASDCSLQITLQNFCFNRENPPKLLALDSKTKEFCYLDIAILSDHNFSTDFSEIQSFLEFDVRKNFQLFFEIIDAQELILRPLIDTREIQHTRQCYCICRENLFPMSEDLDNSLEHLLGTYTTKDKALCISLFTKESYVANTQKGEILSVKIKRNILNVKMKIDISEYQFEKVTFTYRNKLISDAVSYDFTVHKSKIIDQTIHLELSLDLSTIEWKSIYWDFYVHLKHSETNQLFVTRCKLSTARRMYYKLFYNDFYPGENNFFLYPYYTGNQELAFAYRQRGKYDGLDVIFKEILAIWIYRLFKPYWKKKHILLVCEKFSEMAQDNGYYFFKHCMENDEEKALNKEIYYIITKDSPDRKRLEPYRDHLLDFMSMKHLCYLLAADLIVSSDSRYHTYPLQSRHSVFNRYIKKIKFVFLQHGVIALKRVDSFYGKGKNGGCDMFVVSNDFEKGIIVNEFGYEPEEVINTGLPRWDVLQDKSEGKRDILIMPTWRNWLDSVSDDEFEQSDYFTHYMGLLNSERFNQFLKENDLYANFYLHAKFQNYTESFRTQKDSHIRLISFGEIPVNEMLMQCKMLITDYSSVCWDVYYQKKPIIFYQFDLDKYEEAQGSYLDMRNDLFGDRTESLDQLLDSFEEHAKNNFQLKPEYEEMHKEYFKFEDNRHSHHICELIKKTF